jgi:hypothetical protein
MSLQRSKNDSARVSDILYGSTHTVLICDRSGGASDGHRLWLIGVMQTVHGVSHHVSMILGSSSYCCCIDIYHCINY